jgi:hypothetical protein
MISIKNRARTTWSDRKSQDTGSRIAYLHLSSSKKPSKSLHYSGTVLGIWILKNNTKKHEIGKSEIKIHF